MPAPAREPDDRVATRQRSRPPVGSAVEPGASRHPTADPQPTVSDYVWSGINSFFMKGFSTLFVIILGNLLLPAELGVYVSFMLVVSYATTLLSLNLGSGVVQKLNDETLSDRHDEYFTSGALFVGALSVLLPVALYLLRDPLMSWFDLADRALLFQLALPVVFLELNQKYFLGVLQARLDLRYMALVNISAAALKLGLAVLLLQQGHGLVGVVAAIYAADVLSTLLLGRRAFHFHSVSISPRFPAIVGDLARFSGVIHLSAIAVFLDKSVDLFLVNNMLARESVAVYNYALKGSLLLLLVGNTISQVTYPELTRAFTARNLDRVRTLYSRSIRLCFGGLAVFTLLLLAHVDYLIPLFLPEFYLRMIEPFGVLAVAMVLFGATATVGTVFTAMGKPGYGTIINWTALGLNVLLCLFLIPRHGVIGAATATGTTFFLRSVAMLALAERFFETGLAHGRLALALLIFAGSVALVFGAGDLLLSRWLAAGLGGAGVLVLTVKREELDWIRRSLAREPRTG